MLSDVIVTITTQTTAVTQQGFGLPLILDTSKEFAYEEFTELADLAIEYGNTTEVYALAKALFDQTPRVEKVAVFGIAYIAGTDPTTDLTTALDTFRIDHDDWYFLLCIEQGDAEITALSGWTESNEKFYFASSSNLNLPATLSDNERTALLIHNAPDTYPAEAWVGRCAPTDPGSITWKFKTLKGIDVANYSNSQITTLHSNGGNTYVQKLGIKQTSEGLTTSGQYIDIVRGRDWLKSRMTEEVQLLLINNDKIPFDNRGIALVEDRLTKVLREGVENNVIARDDDGNGLWSITVPNRSDVPAADRAARKLSQIKWSATIAGAVHNVTIQGVLEV